MNYIRSVQIPKTSAVILAGGEGQRLLPLTAFRPKPSMPFGGVFRIIDFTLANCLQSGVAEVAVLTQYRREELHSHILRCWSDRWPDSGRQLISRPPANGKCYRGTADAVFQNLPVIHLRRPECVLILSGDHIYNMNYADLLRRHVETGADLTIGVLEHPIEKASEFGVLEVDGDLKVIGFTEKPKTPIPMPQRPNKALISMGVYVFRLEILDEALREHCDRCSGYDFGRNIIPPLVRSARVHAYDFRDEKSMAPAYWRDIGTIDSYYEANMDLVGPTPAFSPDDLPALEPLKLRFALNAESAPLQSVQSVLSPGVRIGAGAHIQSSVLMAGVRVEKDAKIRKAIVAEGVRIPSGFHIGWDIEQDRKQYPVSSGGVVVVNASPKAVSPTRVFVAEAKKKAPFRTPANKSVA
jgi:glucose-1-phosphate adenylyltransferase